MYKWVKIGSMIIFYLRKLWKAKFFILCDHNGIFLVRLQGKFEIGHSWEWKRQIETCMPFCLETPGTKAELKNTLVHPLTDRSQFIGWEKPSPFRLFPSATICICILLLEGPFTLYKWASKASASPRYLVSEVCVKAKQCSTSLIRCFRKEISHCIQSNTSAIGSAAESNDCNWEEKAPAYCAKNIRRHW